MPLTSAVQKVERATGRLELDRYRHLGPAWQARRCCPGWKWWLRTCVVKTLSSKEFRLKDTLTRTQIKIQQENMIMISTKNAISPMLWMITSSQDLIQHECKMQSPSKCKWFLIWGGNTNRNTAPLPTSIHQCWKKRSQQIIQSFFPSESWTNAKEATLFGVEGQTRYFLGSSTSEGQL